MEINILKGRVNRIDLSAYKELVIEMRSNEPYQAQVLIKDEDDGFDGKETKVKVSLTEEWKEVSIPLEKFETADLKTVIVPFGILFEGPAGQSVDVRNVFYR